MPIPARVRCLLPVMLLALASPSLFAQLPTRDSSVRATPPVAAWASLELGSGRAGSSSGELAAALRGTVSVGPLILMYRNGDVGPIFSAGDGVRDDSFMVGARTPWRRLFVSAALGYANVTPYTGCDGCIPSGQAESRSALAYDLSVHANEVVPGLALSYAGAIGPARVRYSAVTLGLELGWFGR